MLSGSLLECCDFTPWGATKLYASIQNCAVKYQSKYINSETNKDIHRTMEQIFFFKIKQRTAINKESLT